MYKHDSKARDMNTRNLSNTHTHTHKKKNKNKNKNKKERNTQKHVRIKRTAKEQLDTKQTSEISE